MKLFSSQYLAPEMIEKRAYDKTVDWWCLGSVLYEILFGLPPFYDKNISIMYHSICNEQLVLPTNINKNKLSSFLLEKDQRIRLGSKDDFKEIKRHPFFAQTDWSMVENKMIKPPFVPHLVSWLVC
ncbi:hypothetical protein HELRODRAFT_92744 [Helobdella robusta]|uniref:Protein kinase domain-containing protein n=1 Tax=Helobdella robusta TaxID=6412 RepID=T1G8K3_HELRO|nr:hypothetical protein HELRODRAFT_92744 [Helobdella robusta]ESN97139.1 hypothetical protein HELRODRAFT_92744 [Helobdella robusta]